jgi:type IV pilus assembly protein PilF
MSANVSPKSEPKLVAENEAKQTSPSSLSVVTKSHAVASETVARPNESISVEASVVDRDVENQIPLTVLQHVVAKSENLYRISLRYNVKMAKLIEWNQLPENGAIQVGMTLLVSEPSAQSSEQEQ